MVVSLINAYTCPHQDFDLTEFIAFGDIYPNALDHFCAWVEEVGFFVAVFLPHPGPGATLSERGKHVEVPPLCLI